MVIKDRGFGLSSKEGWAAAFHGQFITVSKTALALETPWIGRFRPVVAGMLSSRRRSYTAKLLFKFIVGPLMHELLNAPWAKQSVGPFARFLAWVFVICGLFAFSAGAYFTVIEGFPTDMPLEFLGLLVGGFYLLTVFLFVALKGKAPSGWLPWR